MAQVCGIRLNTVGVLIGWMGAAYSFVALIVCCLGLTNLDSLADEIIKQNPDWDKAQLTDMLAFFLYIYLAFLVINLVASSMLVAGTIKEKHLMLVPWLFNSGACLIFNIFISISFLVETVHTTPQPEYVMFIVILSSLAFHSFIWYLIYSLFKTMRSSTEQQRLLAPTSVAAYNGYTSINDDMRKINA